MATDIKLKKSSVAGRVPSTSDLSYGELAINYNDGKLYFKNSSNSIRSFRQEKVFNVSNSGSGAYVFSGTGTNSDSNPDLYLVRGETYIFSIDASGHPFRINSTNTTGSGSAFTDGVTNNGIESGDVTFTVPMDAPSTLYYNCEYHSSMAGTIYVLESTFDGDFTNLTNVPTILDSSAITSLIDSDYIQLRQSTTGGGGSGITTGKAIAMAIVFGGA